MSLSKDRLAASFSTPSFSLFETRRGCGAVVFSARGVLAVQLPSATPDETRARVDVRFPGAREATPPAPFRKLVAALKARLEGKVAPFGDVALDWDGVPEFHRKVYEALLQTRPGQTLRYGELPPSREPPVPPVRWAGRWRRTAGR